MGRDCPRQGPLSRLDGSQCSGRLTRSWGGSMTASWTPDEMMTVEAARRLGNGRVCFVGIGLPSAAANLARLTSGPDRSEEHASELQSLMRISYAVFCLKKKQQ